MSDKVWYTTPVRWTTVHPDWGGPVEVVPSNAFDKVEADLAQANQRLMNMAEKNRLMELALSQIEKGCRSGIDRLKAENNLSPELAFALSSIELTCRHALGKMQKQNE
jgi:hypothetical protein